MFNSTYLFIMPKNKVSCVGYGIFYNHWLISIPISCVPQLRRMVASHEVYPEPSLDWLLDHLTKHNRCPSCVMWPKVETMGVTWITVTKAATNTQLRQSNSSSRQMRPRTECRLTHNIYGMRSVPPCVALKPQFYAPVSISL